VNRPVFFDALRSNPLLMPDLMVVHDSYDIEQISLANLVSEIGFSSSGASSHSAVMIWRIPYWCPLFKDHSFLISTSPKSCDLRRQWQPCENYDPLDKGMTPFHGEAQSRGDGNHSAMTTPE
jgi:hypothetical protein